MEMPRGHGARGQGFEATQIYLWVGTCFTTPKYPLGCCFEENGFLKLTTDFGVYGMGEWPKRTYLALGSEASNKTQFR